MIARSNKKKKKKKWLFWGIIGIFISAVATAAFFMPRGTGAYQEEVAETKDIITYYNFSGTIDSKNRRSIMSEKPLQICEIKVEQGDQINSGDVVIITETGEEIKAPVNGEVSQILIKENSQVMAGAELVKLVDYANLTTKVKVDEFSLKFLKIDQEVGVGINALGKELTGTISDISREAINENGVSYFIATIDLEKDGNLRIGMTTEANIVKEKAIAATTLPMEVILFDDEKQPYVLLPSKEGEPIKQPITTGINDGMVVEVKTGLSAGENVMHATEEEGLLEQLLWRR
ncbi:efflux RND transporter periplasmic adaptor subunit [Planomicrobium sp. CPCC 101079]|uniref:efflux RND transporter periplasmic adaptor subunit n=1 Tax=Planomicrobium sp. CPCC 101079 TaxID=2599618 RepID=UPI0011B70BE9|nr:efflux RND transporter periplasmic adaptor subunit [Planomicrobium sp. CPCC 101079]TWT14279.1 HlyD family efflux transporter periplasmic adaptor subunit [Planomicrobium sp. CPCC 101079]